MLEDLKTLLGISEDDTSRDSLLNLILSESTKRLKALLGGQDPPEELSYIITGVSVIRFNRIGSEGLSSHSVEGESMNFTDNDFAAYMDDIQGYLDAQENATKGRIRFL